MRSHANAVKTVHCQKGPSRDLNPGPLAPEARIIPLDHLASIVMLLNSSLQLTDLIALIVAAKIGCKSRILTSISLELVYARVYKPTSFHGLHFINLEQSTRLQQQLRADNTPFIFLNYYKYDYIN